MLKFLVKNRKIEPLQLGPIDVDDVELVKLKFVFEGQWRHLHKVVEFRQGREVYHRTLGCARTVCGLPIQLHEGPVRMTMLGGDLHESERLHMTTNPVTLTIHRRRFPDYGPYPPSPDLYAQLLREIDRRIAQIELETEVQMRATDDAIEWRGGDDEAWETLIGLDELKGQSAYEAWLEEGNEGSEADFLRSLVGSSAYASVERVANGVTITTTDATGTTTATVYDGSGDIEAITNDAIDAILEKE